MTVEKPKPKQLLRPITTGAGSAMNQSQFLAITCNSLKAREKSRLHVAIGFDSHWLKNWRDSFKPITKRSNCNHVITFDSHLKTALYATTILWPLIPICGTEQFCWRYVNWFNCQRSLWVQQRRVLEQFCKFDFGLGITVCRGKHQHVKCDEGQFQRDSFNLGKGTCWHSKEGHTFPGILASWEGIQEYPP